MLVNVINLERSPDRLAEFRSANTHLESVVRFPGVDGKTLDIAELERQGILGSDLVSPDFYTIGAVGAAMSHIALWDQAVRTHQITTVAEDDAVFHAAFDKQAGEIIRSLPSDWDFILWGWNFDLFLSFEMLPGISLSLSQFEQDRLRANIGSFQLLDIAPHAFRLVWSFGIPCYTVSPKGAAAMKRNCLPLQRSIAHFPPAQRSSLRAEHFRNVGIDSAMNNAYGSLQAYVCFPPLVVTKNDGATSTIQENVS